jgi:hypothetical protein
MAGKPVTCFLEARGDVPGAEPALFHPERSLLENRSAVSKTLEAGYQRNVRLYRDGDLAAEADGEVLWVELGPRRDGRRCQEELMEHQTKRLYRESRQGFFFANPAVDSQVESEIRGGRLTASNRRFLIRIFGAKRKLSARRMPVIRLR